MLASQIGKACVEDRYCLCRGSVFTRVSSLQCALTLVPAAKLCICRVFSASWIYCRHSPGTRGRRCKLVLLCGRSVFFCVRHRYSCFSLHAPHGDFAFRGPYLCGRSVSLPPHHQVSEEAARPCTRAASWSSRWNAAGACRRGAKGFISVPYAKLASMYYSPESSAQAVYPTC